jgi:hypothetical protein
MIRGKHEAFGSEIPRGKKHSVSFFAEGKKHSVSLSAEGKKHSVLFSAEGKKHSVLVSAEGKKAFGFVMTLFCIGWRRFV